MAMVCKSVRLLSNADVIYTFRRFKRAYKAITFKSVRMDLEVNENTTNYMISINWFLHYNKHDTSLDIAKLVLQTVVNKSMGGRIHCFKEISAYEVTYTILAFNPETLTLLQLP